MRLPAQNPEKCQKKGKNARRDRNQTSISDHFTGYGNNKRKETSPVSKEDEMSEKKSRKGVCDVSVPVYDENVLNNI